MPKFFLFSKSIIILLSRAKGRRHQNDAITTDKEHGDWARVLTLELLERLLVNLDMCHRLLDVAYNF